MLREALALCLASLLLCSSASFAEAGSDTERAAAAGANDELIDPDDLSDASGGEPDAAPAPAPEESPAQPDVELVDPDELLGAEERERPFSRDGWYIQFGYAYGIERKLEDELNGNLDKAVIAPSSPFISNPNTNTPSPPRVGTPALFLSIGPADVSNSSGFGFRAGRRVLANVAVELQVEHMTNFQTEIADFGTIDMDTTALTGNLRLPILTGRIQPYALIGAGVMWASPDSAWPQQDIQPSRVSTNRTRYEDIVRANDAGVVLRLGGGVDVYVDEHVYLSSEFAWVASQGEAVNDVKYMSIGLGIGYRF